MATFETVEPGTIALIQQTPEGRILQIGLTPAQSNMLQFFLAKLSEESKLIQMPEDYDLILKKFVMSEVSQKLTHNGFGLCDGGFYAQSFFKTAIAKPVLYAGTGN